MPRWRSVRDCLEPDLGLVEVRAMRARKLLDADGNSECDMTHQIETVSTRPSYLHIHHVRPA